MKILTASDLPLRTPVAAALGFFDGVHRGHMALLKKLEEQPLPSLVYTFDRKPNVPKPLFTPEERAVIMECDGIDYYYTASFDVAFSEQSPRAFVQRMMRQFDIKTIVVGSDYRFGADAAGDVGLLRDLSQRYGYNLVVVPVRSDDSGEKYASTVLRHLIHSGDVEKANELMDRAYFIDGIVETGSRLGERIGYPTANIRSEKLLPSYGVYVTLTRTSKGIFPSVTNVGRRPTIEDNDSVNIETHLLDHNEDLYGQPIRVYFIRRLRPETKFADVDALQEQIGRDSKAAAEVLRDPDVYTRYRMC